MQTACRLQCYWGKISLWAQTRGRVGMDIPALQRLSYGAYALPLGEPASQQDETKRLLGLEVRKVEEHQWPTERRRCAGGSN